MCAIIQAIRLEIKSNNKEGGDIMRTYGRLREKIKTKYNTLEDFSNAMDIDRGILSKRLNGKTGWKSSEIELACRLLDIPMEQVGEYFFY